MSDEVELPKTVDIKNAAALAKSANHRERVFLGIDRENPKAQIYSYLGDVIVRFDK